MKVLKRGALLMGDVMNEEQQRKERDAPLFTLEKVLFFLSEKKHVKLGLYTLKSNASLFSPPSSFAEETLNRDTKYIHSREEETLILFYSLCVLKLCQRG